MSHGAPEEEVGRSVDVLGDLFYPLFDAIFDDDSQFVADLDDKLAQARMAEAVELYISRALAYGIITGGVLWILGMALGFFLFATGLIEVGPLVLRSITNEQIVAVLDTLRVPLLVLLTGVVFGTIGFGLGFGGLVAIPYSRASGRKREINMLLPDAVAFMYALSVGGLNQLEILEAMAKAEDTYGEVAKEFQTIVQETEYFDTDYRTAIRNQAMHTPSSELSQFLTDMLSIINSGGDIESFLDEKKEKHLRTAKQQQQQTLETLELFGEMYLTLSLFPLLLIIVLVIMQMVGEADVFLLYATVYGLIPLTGVAFLVMISTVKQDEPGDGYLDLPIERASPDTAASESHRMFDQIRRREQIGKFLSILRRPHAFFKENPLYTLAVTVPLALGVLAIVIIMEMAPTTWGGGIDGSAGMVHQPVWGTFVWIYLPAYLTLVPLAIFYEWNVRSRRGITANLSENLRKLSSANDTGLTLLESFKTVSDTTGGKLGQEFQTIHAKVRYGTSLQTALIEFNNKYHLPRMARLIKLISKAQEASSQITEVLSTAATASENQDEIIRERKTRTRMQTVIIVMTFFTLLAVMAILQTQFVDVMDDLVTGAGGDAEGAAGLGAGDIDPTLLSLLFFHAITMQAILSGLISGYMRDGTIISGVKYVLALMTISIGVWMFVG